MSVNDTKQNLQSPWLRSHRTLFSMSAFNESRYYNQQLAGKTGVPPRPLMSPPGNGWFNFACAKPRSQRSALLEANLAAKSGTVPLCVPCEAGEIGLRRVWTEGSLLSEASTAPGVREFPEVPRRASFADQQQQPLEKMCGPFAPDGVSWGLSSLTYCCPPCADSMSLRASTSRR